MRTCPRTGVVAKSPIVTPMPSPPGFARRRDHRPRQVDAVHRRRRAPRAAARSGRCRSRARAPGPPPASPRASRRSRRPPRSEHLRRRLVVPRRDLLAEIPVRISHRATVQRSARPAPVVFGCPACGCGNDVAATTREVVCARVAGPPRQAHGGDVTDIAPPPHQTAWPRLRVEGTGRRPARPSTCGRRSSARSASRTRHWSTTGGRSLSTSARAGSPPPHPVRRPASSNRVRPRRTPLGSVPTAVSRPWRWSRCRSPSSTARPCRRSATGHPGPDLGATHRGRAGVSLRGRHPARLLRCACRAPVLAAAGPGAPRHGRVPLPVHRQGLALSTSSGARWIWLHPVLRTPRARHPGGAPNCGDWVMVEGYSRAEQLRLLARRWEEGAFYAYAYPEPDGFADHPVRPGGVLQRRRSASSSCRTRRSARRTTRTRRCWTSCRRRTRRPPSMPTGPAPTWRTTRLAGRAVGTERAPPAACGSAPPRRRLACRRRVHRASRGRLTARAARRVTGVARWPARSPRCTDGLLPRVAEEGHHVRLGVVDVVAGGGIVRSGHMRSASANWLMNK